MPARYAVPCAVYGCSFHLVPGEAGNGVVAADGVLLLICDRCVARWTLGRPFRTVGSACDGAGVILPLFHTAAPEGNA